MQKHASILRDTYNFLLSFFTNRCDHKLIIKKIKKKKKTKPLKGRLDGLGIGKWKVSRVGGRENRTAPELN